MRKIATIGIVGTLLFGSFVTAVGASSVSGVRFVNNESSKISYKIDVDEVKDSISVRSPVKEVFGGDSARTLDYYLGNSEMNLPHLNWVSSQLSVERDISVENGKFSVGDIPTSHYGATELLPITKSDFLMYLYQIVYEPIISRSISFKAPSERLAGEQYTYQHCELDSEGNEVCEDRIAYRDPPTNQDVSNGKPYKVTLQGEDTAGVYTFTEGDYYFYYTPNVKELYLKEIIAKGIISLSEVSDISFNELYNGKSRAPWDNKLPTFPMGYADRNDLNSISISEGYPLGRSFEISGVSAKDKSGEANFTIKYTPKPYLFDEDLKVIDAYKLVEKFVRLTEKDMTDTEAKIVSYKYGMNYLDNYSEEDRKTLMFLTAKGILDFEDESEFKNLYLDLDPVFGYELLYRTGNKDARLNFSEIQLTDFDNFWINRGFSQSKFKVYMGNGLETFIPEVKTLSVEELEVTARSTENYIASNFAAGEGTYVVTKSYQEPDKYYFMGKKVSELTSSDDFVFEVKSTTSGFEVKFQVPASSPMNALQLVDSNIVIDTSAYMFSDNLMSVSKIDVEGKILTLVPANSLKLLGFNGTKIEILEDKVLRNSSTGATAILLPDNDVALVGSHVISSSEIMVEAINGEIYYNLEIIRTLLPNLYISELDQWSLFFTEGMKDEKVVKILSEDTDAQIGSSYFASFTTFPEPSDVIGPSNTFKSYPFVSLSHLGNSTNTVIKDFKVLDEFGSEISFKIVMFFRFKLPDSEIGFTDPIQSSSNPKYKEVHDFIYSAPEDPELLDVWNNNKEISNGLLNATYGSSGVDYVKSGWIYPSLHIIYDNTYPNQIKLLRDFFVEAGMNISDEWYQRFIGRSKAEANKVVSDSGFDSINEDGKYYPRKELTVDMFPMWVHAMFNNGAALPQLNSNYLGNLTGNQSAGRANTTLWRSMMDSRVFLYQSTVLKGAGYSSYSLGKYTYVINNGGNVFLRLDDNNDLFTLVDRDVFTSGRPTREQVVVVRTRTDDNSLVDKVGNIVSFNDSELKFYVNSVFGDYIKVTDMSALVGSLVVKDDGITFRGRVDYYGNSNTSSIVDNVDSSRYGIIRSLFNKANYDGYANVLGSWGSHGSTFGDIGNHTRYPYVLSSSLASGINQYTPVAMNQYGQTLSLSQIGSESLYGYISFLLPRDKFTITDANELYARKTYPFLNLSNIYNTSITKNVIDSTLYNYNGTVTVDKIPSGAELRVGDLVFIKTGDRFTSRPVKVDSAARGVIADPTSNSKLKDWVLTKFVGLSINVAGTTNSPLANYISNIQLGSEDNVSLGKGKVLVKSGATPALLTVSSKGRELQLFESASFKGVDYISFELILSSDLLARNSFNDNTYELLYYTAEFAEGSVDNLPFFNEDLSLGSYSFDTLSGNKTNNAIINTSGDLKKKYMEFTKDLFGESLYSTIKFWVLFFISFVAGMTVLAFTLTYLDVFRNILLDFRDKRNGEKGIDVIKWVTFGLRDLDNPIKAFTMFFVTFVCALFFLAVMVFT